MGGGISNKKSTILIVILLLILTLGISFAYWQVTENQKEENIVTSSCLDISYTDKNVIRLEKTVPIIDEEGASLVPYEFTITNLCETNATFPTLYLKSNVKITSGTGSSTDPFTLE